jgi:hypothetical protein
VPLSPCKARQPLCAAGDGDGDGDGDGLERLEVQVHGWHACSHARTRMRVLCVYANLRRRTSPARPSAW